LAAELTSEHVHYELEDSDIIRLLLEFGGDVNIPTKLVRFYTYVHSHQSVCSIGLLSVRLS